jgi:hypothetical protein
MKMHFAFESTEDSPSMSELLNRVRCEACHSEFDSAEELDEHNARLQEPQPTLPVWTRDPMLELGGP